MTTSWNRQPIAAIEHPEGFGVLGEKYFEALAVANNSPRTIEGKRYSLRLFASWCEVRAIDKPEQLTQKLAQRYQRHIHHHRKEDGQALSIGTQRGRMGAVKMFYRWLVKAGYLNYSPVETIELPKMPMQLPKAVLSASEMEILLAQADLGTVTGLRDRAIMETLYSTGVRRNECLGLLVNDLDRSRGLLRVTQGKGQKDRIIPIGNRAVYWIERYLVDSRPELVKQVSEPTLFISNQGKPIHPTTLTRRLGDYLKQSGLKKTGSVHLFRHTAGTLMLENGADIRHIQALLGHANLSTTQVYTQVAIGHLKEVHEQTHPAKLKDKQ